MRPPRRCAARGGCSTRSDAPRGQQGVALIADAIGDVPAVLDQLQALRRDGVRVSLAVHTPRAVGARVVRAVEATGGSVLATHDEAELRALRGDRPQRPG